MRRSAWTLFLATSLLLGCNPQDRTLPEEFPPVRLGMERREVRRILEESDARIAEDNARLLRAVERDRRVAEEVFLFYKDRLAAFTIRYPGPATRAVFQRQSRRFGLTFGDPYEQRDDGMVLLARWRAEETGGRVLLSAFIGGSGESPLMARIEDPSVVPRLIRQMERDSL